MSEEQIADSSGKDVDAILAEVESSRTTAPEMQSQPQQVAQEPQARDFKIGDKTIKATQEQIDKWAMMGYDAPNKIGQLNTKLQEFEGRAKSLSGLEEKYGQVDKYAAQNPEWWAHVQSQWQQQAQDQNKAMTGNEKVDQYLQGLHKELDELKSFKEELVTEKVAKQRVEEDTKLQGEIESIRKQYPDLDLDSPDGEGKSLEYKVLEHAYKNGIQNFNTAFRDFYHDSLMKRAEERGKEAVGKDLQKRTKLGLLGETSVPKRQLSRPTNLKDKSYADLAKEALDEMNKPN